MSEPWEWKLPDLEGLVGLSESIRLEFKDSRLFTKSHEEVVTALSREVSAFANTEGGAIIIGMTEERVGKQRVAKGLDAGLDLSVWSAERIQQMIASSISPTLPAIRVHSVRLNKDTLQSVFVIYVPPGATAYQAKDFLYYGRWDYEAKPLPDHEIRLRMNRNRSPQATIYVSDVSKRHTHTELPQRHIFEDANPILRDYVGDYAPGKFIDLDRYDFEIVMLNSGLVNIHEYQVEIVLLPNGFPGESDAVVRAIDGEYLDESTYNAGRITRSKVPRTVSIFPGAEVKIDELCIELPPHRTIREFPFRLDWKIYLRDTLPSSGSIDLIPLFDEIEFSS